jgi:hypothetical protein
MPSFQRLAQHAMDDPVIKNTDKQSPPTPVDKKQEVFGREDSARFSGRGEDVSRKFADKVGPDPADRIRWILWSMVVLVMLCLALAFWVWVEILHITR